MTYPAPTHTDAHGMPCAFYDGGDDHEPLPYYPTPCCNAAVSIFADDGRTYCKECYADQDPILGGVPEAPFTPIGYEIILPDHARAEADDLPSALLAAATLVGDADPFGAFSRTLRNTIVITRGGQYDGAATTKAREGQRR